MIVHDRDDCMLGSGDNRPGAFGWGVKFIGPDSTLRVLVIKFSVKYEGVTLCFMISSISLLQQSDFSYPDSSRLCRQLSHTLIASKPETGK